MRQGESSMRVLVACEFSGRVRDAFLAKGHDAWSCDIVDSDSGGPHLKGDVIRHLEKSWHMMIGFPPCTYLASSGARWWRDREREQQDALAFVRKLMEAPIKRICIENPIGRISTAIKKPDQIIHPWQFGHPETKSTCLWLSGLPLLLPTRIVDGREERIHQMSPSPMRSKLRSLTYSGIAAAMAEQWS